MNDISKYVQVNDYLLIEYVFNKAEILTDLTGIKSIVGNNIFGTKQYFNQNSIGVLNNDLVLNSEPLDANRSGWYVTTNGDISNYGLFFDSSVQLVQPNYVFDTVKVHIVSGYNFDDIPGFFLNVGALDTSNNHVDLSNFTWLGQILGNSVLKFSPNALFLGNRFYDKYVEFKVPSVQKLGGNNTEPIEQALSIQTLSDVYFTYTSISNIINNNFIPEERIELQLPVSSQADNFNAFIAESTSGDYIEFYATWKNTIIGEYMGDIESGRIKLFTSNNPNDNFEEFSETYGSTTAKWVVMHEIYVYEHIPGNTILTQQLVFTQSANFTFPNYFRPIIQNSDIVSSYTINYICRLTNRMDGSQIIRSASFASTDPKKYGRYFTRINVDNYIPYKVFNKIEGEASTTLAVTNNKKTQFVKVYYDTTRVLLDMNNNVLPQGTGPLFIKNGNGIYKMSFSRSNQNNNEERQNVDLSGAYNYTLLFVLDNDTKIEIPPTYSTNMNTTLGEIEFEIKENQALELLKQTNNSYSILVKNPNGTNYTFYQGFYYAFSNYQQVISEYSNLLDLNSLKEQISLLQAENKSLKEQIATKA